MVAERPAGLGRGAVKISANGPARASDGWSLTSVLLLAPTASTCVPSWRQQRRDDDLNSSRRVSGTEVAEFPEPTQKVSMEHQRGKTRVRMYPSCHRAR
jgi:hypothetical protein